MPANIGNALSAYSKTASRGTTNGLEARDVKDPGKDFATFVKEADPADRGRHPQPGDPGLPGNHPDAAVGTRHERRRGP
jgi:hypothetical protein